MRTLLLATALFVAASAAVAAPAAAYISITACAGQCFSFYPPDPCNTINPGNLCYLPPGPCYGTFFRTPLGLVGAQVCHFRPQ